MSNIIRVKIDVTKIEKARLFIGKPREDGSTPKYLNCTLVPKQSSQYGDTHFVSQDVTKEEREAGKKGPIIGNATELAPKNQTRPARQQTTTSKPQKNDDDDWR